MGDTIRLIGYNPCSVNDGVGLREVFYVAECTHKCYGCHNEVWWNDKGTEYDINKLVEVIKRNDLTQITISGGDGLTVQYEATVKFCKKIKEETGKNIWLYTGYTYEQLFKLDKTEILKYIDVLVDGRFERDSRDITLKFRGSKNQRIIDVAKSIDVSEVVLWEGME